MVLPQLDLHAECPDDDQLRLVVAGTMPPKVFDLLCQHVESCNTCQNRLESIRESTDCLLSGIQSITHDDLAKARQELETESKGGLIQAAIGPEAIKSLAKPALNPPCDLGPYEVQEFIARGGMGEIYKARHKRLGRPVALKVIRGYRLDDPATHEHFLHEMANAGKLDHPNLVRAYDAWEADGCLYMAFELLDGQTLQQVFTAESKPSVVDALHCLLGICSGLNRLHQQNLVHCDLKPSNVMRLPDGTIKLIDIGLAKTIGPNRSFHAPGSGTKGYIAPEAENFTSPIDQRSDLYSLGKIVEFMLANSDAEQFASKGNQELKIALRRVATKLIQVSPADRFQNICEVIAALNQAASESKRQGENSSRKWLITGLVATGVLLTGTYAVWHSATAINNHGSAHGGVSSKAEPISMRMAIIPAGSFMMGAVENDPDAKPDELPRRKIQFTKPFKMGVTEVTVGQFREFVQATGYKTEAELSGKGGWKAGMATSWSEQNPEFKWSNPGYPIADDLPVTVVTYKDANEFCSWLSQRDGCRYRLPTEAEWEYACRAGSAEIYPFPIDLKDTYAWSSFNVKASLSPRPVGTRLPNAWGLVDTIGNVREWCQDWYGDMAYQIPYAEAPLGPSDGTMRAIRGACFMDKTGFLRPSKRGYLAPDLAINNQGFRVVSEVD